jgi:hypothetical protein
MTGFASAPAAISAAAVADHARAIARAHAAHYGIKRGLGVLARILGSERRARGIYAGEARRIEAHEYLALLDAEQALRRERADRLRAELAMLEQGVPCACGSRLRASPHGSATARTTSPRPASGGPDAP